MRSLSRLALCLPWLTGLSSTVIAQTVTETRTFQQEVFAIGPGSNISYLPLFDLGLTNPPDLATSEVVNVKFDLTVDWDIHLRVANLSQTWTSAFTFNENIWLFPRLGDCAPYTYVTLQGETDVLAPGEVGEIQIQTTTPMNVSWEDGYFLVACEDNTWPWPDLWMGSVVISPPGPFTYAGGLDVPQSWVRILEYRATVTGTFEVEYVANPVDHQVVCHGDWPYQLVPGSDPNNFWLYHPNAPDTFGMLLQSTQAQPIPGTRLCVGGGLAPITRIVDSVSVGGQPYLLPNSAALAGTTQYFQAWYRSPWNNGPLFSECLAVNFP